MLPSIFSFGSAIEILKKLFALVKTKQRIQGLQNFVERSIFSESIKFRTHVLKFYVQFSLGQSKVSVFCQDLVNFWQHFWRNFLLKYASFDFRPASRRFVNVFKLVSNFTFIPIDYVDYFGQFYVNMIGSSKYIYIIKNNR